MLYFNGKIIFYLRYLSLCNDAERTWLKDEPRITKPDVKSLLLIISRNKITSFFGDVISITIFCGEEGVVSL